MLLLGRQRHRLLDAIERGKIRRQMDVGVHARRRVGRRSRGRPARGSRPACPGHAKRPVRRRLVLPIVDFNLVSNLSRSRRQRHAQHLPRRQMEADAQRVLRRFLDRFADRRMRPHRLGHVAAARPSVAMSAVAAAMHSVALWPIKWAPSSSSVSRWRIIFTKPSGAGRPSPCPNGRSGSGRSRSAGRRRGLPARSCRRRRPRETCKRPTGSPRRTASRGPAAFSAAATPWADAAWASMLRPLASPIV